MGSWEGEEERERRGEVWRGGKARPRSKDRRKRGKTAGQRERKREERQGQAPVRKEGERTQGMREKRRKRQPGGGRVRVGGVGVCSPAPLTVIKDIDVLRRQRVFAQVKGNPMLAMTPSPRPPCPLPAAQSQPGIWEAVRRWGRGMVRPSWRAPGQGCPAQGLCRGGEGAPFNTDAPAPGRCLASCLGFSSEEGWEGMPSGLSPGPVRASPFSLSLRMVGA